MRVTKKHRSMRSALALASSSLLAACGAASERAAPAPSFADEALESGEPPAPVQAGLYRLSMSAHCDTKDKTATGTLTLQPMSGVADDAGAAEASDTLLWGQTNLDFRELAGCLRPSAPVSGEPIHPGILVEVLHWDGDRRHQVLLVSTDSAPAGSSAGVGFAMWVERVDRGHIAGVWSRWQLMGRGEGRWEAELMPGP
jgi:hypothetical protein